MMKNNKLPLVSILCDTYNHEKYISQALDSFIMQQTIFPFEIIVHDDASTDNTAQIIREYELKYPNLFVPIYQSENQYSKKDVNIWTDITFPKARGKYIALCEGDDYWTDPYKLQKQVDFLETNCDYALCFHNVMFVYEDRKKRSHLFTELNKNDFDVIDVIQRDWFIPTQSMCFRRQYLLEGLEWARYVFNGDYALQLSLAAKGKIWGMDESMAVYRRNDKSISSKARPGFHFIKIIETLSFFNLFTNFKYNQAIQIRMENIRLKLYSKMVLAQPLWRKIFILDYYLIKIKELLG
jgi:glycosyltransferase involved in cell wall biosynthesis